MVCRFRSALKLIGTSNRSSSSEYWAQRRIIGSKGSAERDNFMDEHQNPEEATESGKDNLSAAAGNLKEAAGAKAEDLSRAASQKADELRSAAQDRAQELRGTAESA
jgi:hypothetical protein